MRRAMAVLAVVMLMLVARIAAAEDAAPAPPVTSRPPVLPRGFAGAAVGGEVTNSNFSTSVDFTLYTQATSFDTSYRLPGALAFEGHGGIRFWRSLGVEVALSSCRRKGDAAISASLPHPFFFDRPRALDASVSDLQRSERGIHVGLLWMTRTSRRTLLTLAAGPSFIAYDQDVATSLVLNEVYPYDTVALRRPSTEPRSGTAIGGHVSGELYVKLSRQVAVGGGVRFSRATDTVEIAPGGSTSLWTGGLQVTGGLRWLF